MSERHQRNTTHTHTTEWKSSGSLAGRGGVKREGGGGKVRGGARECEKKAKISKWRINHSETCSLTPPPPPGHQVIRPLFYLPPPFYHNAYREFPGGPSTRLRLQAGPGSMARGRHCEVSVTATQERREFRQRCRLSLRKCSRPTPGPGPWSRPGYCSRPGLPQRLAWMINRKIGSKSKWFTPFELLSFWWALEISWMFE